MEGKSHNTEYMSPIYMHVTWKRLQTNNAKKKKQTPKTHDCLGVVGSQENLTLLHNPCSEFLEGFQVFSSLQGQNEGELKSRAG